MEKNETMVLYVTHYETIKMLPQEDQLLTLKAIIEYSFYDIEPQLEGVPNIIFSMARPNIDASNRRKKLGRVHGSKGASHGQKGGRPRGEFIDTKTPYPVSEKPPTRFSENPLPGLKKTPNVTVKVNVKDTVNVNEKVNKSFNRGTSPVGEKKKDFHFEGGPNAQQEKTDTEVAGGEAKPKPFTRWDKNDLAQAIHPFVAKYGKDACNSFFKYWSEPTASGKMRVNLEKAFDVSRRLSTWRKNDQAFYPKQAQQVEMPTKKFKTKAEAEQWVIDSYYHGRRELSALGMGIPLTDEHDQPRPIEQIRKDVEHHMTSYQN
jgi:hypothetical protein